MKVLIRGAVNAAATTASWQTAAVLADGGTWIDYQLRRYCNLHM